MSNRINKAKTRKKKAKVSKGRELLFLKQEQDKQNKNKNKKNNKAKKNNKVVKNKAKTIVKEKQKIKKQTKEIKTKNKENKKTKKKPSQSFSKAKKKTDLNKEKSDIAQKETQVKEVKKQNITSKVLTILIIMCLFVAIGYFGYGYIYNNYINKGNYLFQTNIKNTTAQLSSSIKDLDIINEEISESVIYISLDYDLINIKNNYAEESFTNNQPFFKYYGQASIIMPINTTYTLDYLYFNPQDTEQLSFISNNDCVDIYSNTLKASSNGETTIYACFGDNKIKILDVISSNLIVERPKEFDTSKEFLSCEQYTNEENEMLDRILKEKIDNVGYHTRAGAVEALRFMTLDLPYRVNYFYENGRLPYVDAQGRYYHKGLYLSSGKYSQLNDPDYYNKGTWGCKIYSAPAEEYMANGLDCSGLMGWALFNDGFDPGDIKGSDLLLDLGEIHDSKEIINSGRVKVGDFVHNNEASSHIGMLIGIEDDENYYVCQAIWYKPNGVCISKYTKEEFVNHWLQIVLLDEYYGEDGNLTNMWY